MRSSNHHASGLSRLCQDLPGRMSQASVCVTQATPVGSAHGQQGSSWSSVKLLKPGYAFEVLMDALCCLCPFCILEKMVVKKTTDQSFIMTLILMQTQCSLWTLIFHSPKSQA